MIIGGYVDLLTVSNSRIFVVVFFETEGTLISHYIDIELLFVVRVMHQKLDSDPIRCQKF